MVNEHHLESDALVMAYRTRATKITEYQKGIEILKAGITSPCTINPQWSAKMI